MLRWFALLLLASVPFVSGCFLAIPSVARCPGAPVPNSDEVVAVVARATRVQHGTAPVPEESHTLRRVELSGGEVGSQVQPFVARGMWLGSWHSTYVLTKLYRRGYKTVVLDGHDDTAKVTWQTAETPDDRETAVRELLYHARPGYARVPKPTLPPGSSDPRHRDVLLFAVREFEWVASQYPIGTEGRARCRSEADMLRSRAAE